MTPLSLALRYYRTERGLSQNELARRSGLGQRTLSAIETGRRQLRLDQDFQALVDALTLDADEISKLREAAQISSRRIRIPDAVSPRELRLMHQLAARLGNLQERQIAQIRDALSNGS